LLNPGSVVSDRAQKGNSYNVTTEAGEQVGPVPRATWTVWFDPSGATNKVMGLRLARPEPPPQDDNQGSVEILGPKGDVIKKMSPEEAAEQGLEIREGFSGGGFVLEVKIPLVTSDGHTVAVGAAPNGVVGVGFMSGRPNRKDWREGAPGGGTGGRGRAPGDIGRPGGGGPGGGIPGGRSGRRGGMPAGSRPSMNPDIPKDVKVWTRVKLLATDQPGPSKVLSLSID
jgi:hypothetical protein